MSLSLEDFIGKTQKIGLRADEFIECREKLQFAVRKGVNVRHKVRMDDTTLLQAAQNISLSPSERVQMKERLLEAMGANRITWWSFSFKSFTTVTAALLIVTLTGTGISYAAEQALPGDLLYPVKVEVNERMVAGLIRDPEEQVRWLARRAERRLEEAEKLAEDAKLTEETEARIAAAFEAHAKEIDDRVTTLLTAKKPVEAAQLSMDFSASLGAHSSLIQRIGARNDRSLAKLMKKVRDARVQSEEKTIVAAMSSDQPTVSFKLAEAAVKHADKEISKTDAAANVAAKRELKQAQDDLASAAQTARNDEELKVRLSRNAMRRAKEAKIMLSAPARKSTTNNEDEDDGGKADIDALSITASAKLKMSRDRLNKINADFQGKTSVPETQAVPMEAHVMGSEQLIDIATQQLESGNIPDALSASDDALKHADEAVRNAENLLKGL